MEVSGDVTTLDLSGLISQTEYGVAVTPMYDTGPGQTMIGNAITGQNVVARFTRFYLLAGPSISCWLACWST